MGAAAIITGVLAQFEELLDIHVPGLEVGTNRPFTFASLIHSDSRVIDHLQEGNNALAFAIGALDVGAKRAHRCPVIAQTAGKLGQHRVVLNRPIYTEQVIGHCRQITGAQLRSQGAGIEQRRCRAHVVE